MKVICIAGARPNFIKISPLMKAFGENADIDAILVHTGQHYDEEMSGGFFKDLGLKLPDVNLGVGSGSHAFQTAEIMKAFEPVVLKEKPDLVLVVGDVNSTIACGLVASKMGIKLAHVEAGLRSFDRTMPEEINRILTDSISDMLFCTELSGVQNLQNEGIPEDKIFLVGNVMIDTLMQNMDKAGESEILDRLSIQSDEYVLLTLHRPSNVDDKEVLAGLLDTFQIIQNEIAIICPAHPRTKKSIRKYGFENKISGMKNFRIIEPAGYLDFMKLMSNAKFIMTDSGGIQEEATVLKKRCLTLRDNTERPSTCESGSNILVGNKHSDIIEAVSSCMEEEQPITVPEYWDGKSSERIVRIICSN